jgi:AbrB family looped-hinge helix DNA binding protein
VITTLSSKGQVVLPRVARAKLHLVSGTKFECTIQGDSIVLTPQNVRKSSPQLIEDKKTGLIVTQSPSEMGLVTNEMIRNLLLDFP